MILFRSIFFELWAPFLITGGVMSFLLIMQNFYQLVALLVEKGLRAVDVALMLAYLLPEAFSITIPLGVVGAVFVTVVRLSSDAELITIRAAGKSLWGLLAPFLAFGLVTSLLTLVVSLWLNPAGFRKHVDLQLQVIKSHADRNLVPGRFVTDFGDKVIQIGGRLETGEVSEVFIADQRHTARSSIIVADRGTIEVDDEAKRVFFRLKQGIVYFPATEGDGLNTVGFERLNYLLNFAPAASVRFNRYKRMDTPQLVNFVRDAKSGSWPETKGMLELFQRLTLPWSCLVFALAAVPMAIVDTRMGKTGSYMRAIFLVVTYYVIWLGLRDHVQSGGGRPAVLWLPLILIFLFGMLRVWMENGGHWGLMGFRRRKKTVGKT